MRLGKSVKRCKQESDTEKDQGNYVIMSSFIISRDSRVFSWAKRTEPMTFLSLDFFQVKTLWINIVIHPSLSLNQRQKVINRHFSLNNKGDYRIRNLD